ncbi:MAG: hypothetical protein GXX93_06840 [Anaerolineae bacterium]|nr:hypothetical protein [Anaerolineae bacterium]
MNPLVLVDANPATRETLAGMLAGIGPPVIAFGDWKAARAAMWHERPQVVVLSDWRARGGRGAHRRLLPAARGAPFVMVCDGGVTEWDERFAVVLRYPLPRGELQSAIRAATAASREVVYAGYRLDRQARSLRRRARSVQLTPVQAAIMCALMRAQGEPVPAADLAAAVWPDQDDHDLRTLYTHLSWLRGRLAAAGLTVAIVSERGQGYRFVGLPAQAPPGARAGE